MMSALEEKVNDIKQCFREAENATIAYWNELSGDPTQPNMELSQLWASVGEAINEFDPDNERMGMLAQRCYRKREYWANPAGYLQKYKDENPDFINLAPIKAALWSALQQAAGRQTSPAKSADAARLKAGATAQPRHQRQMLVDLRQKLEKYFNTTELRTLCFDLGIESEGFPPLLADFSRELIRYCVRHEIIPDLVAYCRQMRPRVSWPGATPQSQ